MLSSLLDANRSTKRLISIAYDLSALIFALYLSLSLRYGEVFLPLSPQILSCFAAATITAFLAFSKLKLYKIIVRYDQSSALQAVAIGLASSALVYSASSFFIQAVIPRSSPIIFFITALALLSAPRFLTKQASKYDRLSSKKENVQRNPVIIYGAGHSGYELALNLTASSRFEVVAFIDDNYKLAGNKLYGIQIHKSSKLKRLADRNDVSTVLLALGKATRSQRAKIIQKLENEHLTTLSIPPIEDIINGNANIGDLKPVAIEDLLGRDPVPAQPELLSSCIEGKSVMVTGAGGSIGSELCRQIIKQKPSKLVLFELNEFNLYTIEQELRKKINTNEQQIELIPVIGSILSPQLLSRTISSNNINTIYHAAAYKHVPLVEANICQGVSNNVLGTLNCAQEAIANQVESFILISTDKAVRPTNIMGASKRLAELTLQALAQQNSNTKITMVRFGNVLGSSGSVVPLFKKQIKNNGPVTVTHPDIIRYFMTIPEAAELVIQAGALGKGGDVLILDMGAPVKIADLAKKMIHLSGLEVKSPESPEGDIEITYTGLRPGEKLYEELLIGDNTYNTQHPRIMRAEENSLNWKRMQEILQEIKAACDKQDAANIKQILLNAPTGYNPTNAEKGQVTVTS